jgi:MscS family membrane protein
LPPEGFIDYPCPMMIELLERTFLGIELGHWAECIAYMAGGLIVGKLVSFLSSRALRRLAARTKSKMDDIILSVAERPLVLILVMAGAGIGLGRLGLEGKVALWSGRVIEICTTLAIAWAVDRGVAAIIRAYLVPAAEKAGSKLRDSFLPLFKNVAQVLIWALAVLVALTNAGYDVGALVAGLGIGGVAVAFAAKDTIANFFGSLAVFIDKPFALGDRIKVLGYDGVIKEIGIRTSRLTTLENRVVTIPNSAFASGAIEDVSAEPNTRVAQTIEISPAAGFEGAQRAIALLREAADALPGLDSGTVAALSGFGRGSLQLSFIVFINRGADYFGTLSAVNLEVLRRFEAAGIELAQPTAPPAPKS